MREDAPVDRNQRKPSRQTDAPPMLAVYRHDVHKLRLRSHAAAVDEIGGVRVNEQVPLGADRDAALLSRPRGEPEQTVDRYESLFRRSLITGDVVASRRVVREGAGAFEDAVASLLEIEDPAAAHAWWVESDAAALVNESPYYPYTSLKYHVLLAAALLDNYRAGHDLAELCLTVDQSGTVTPHRTIARVPGGGVVCLTADPGQRPAAWVGEAPARSFADVWARLPTFPVAVDEERWRRLDAQLRRVRSWSAALQYIEEYAASEFAAAGGDES